ITREKKAQSLLDDYNQTLAVIAEGNSSLSEILDEINIMVQKYTDARCSIMLHNEDSQKIVLESAPSLPKSFVKNIAAIDVGLQSASFEAAAYPNEPVFIPDVT